MFKIKGLDKLQRDLRGVQEALQELDGEFGNVSFDPNDPESIELAINSTGKLIDLKTANFQNNDIIASLVEEMKEKYRALILEKAAEARIRNEE